MISLLVLMSIGFAQEVPPSEPRIVYDIVPGIDRFLERRDWVVGPVEFHTEWRSGDRSMLVRSRLLRVGPGGESAPEQKFHFHLKRAGLGDRIGGPQARPIEALGGALFASMDRFVVHLPNGHAAWIVEYSAGEAKSPGNEVPPEAVPALARVTNHLRGVSERPRWIERAQEMDEVMKDLGLSRVEPPRALLRSTPPRHLGEFTLTIGIWNREALSALERKVPGRFGNEFLWPVQVPGLEGFPVRGRRLSSSPLLVADISVGDVVYEIRVRRHVVTGLPVPPTDLSAEQLLREVALEVVRQTR
jgi:hypothetical protein